MFRRVIILSLVLAASLLLMFVKNKVMVGEQELQATIQALPAGEAKDVRSYTVAFTDLGGNGVLASSGEVEALVKRLAGGPNQEPIATASAPVLAADQTVTVTVPTKVDEQSLRSRIQGAPFRRSNESKDLFHLNLGIDIRGGVEFVCQLRNENGDRVNADDEVMQVLRGRLDERGLTEPLVTKLSNGDIQVVIPGGSRADAARTRKVLEDTGRLEFREILEEYPYVQLGQADQKVVAKPSGGYTFAPGTSRQRGDVLAYKRTEPGLTPSHFYRLGKPALTGKDVADAYETMQEGERAVGIHFTATGAAKNAEFTTTVKERGDKGRGTGRIAIIFDGVVQSDPRIISPSQASCVITGRFTTDEINRLRTSLKAGSLTVTPEVISERVVGATLGAESVTKAMIAMAASFLIIALFMWFYYGRRLGTVANLCLLLTAGVIYATLAVFDATLTLPGLAGLVLIIGMAVDTNILVFERIREEQAENKGLDYAIEHGYGRAFWTIVDAHLTTFATALVLYWIGSGPVKGFGLTLMIGIIVNLFSGIYAGRLFTDWLCKGQEKVKMAAWVPPLRLPYVEWRWAGYIFSIVTGIAGIAYFSVGHLFHGSSFESKFDIDFTGGNMVQVIFTEKRDMDQVEKSIKAAYDAASKDLNLLSPSDLRMQAYFASLGDSGASRQWVFRGRDEQGAHLETERDQLESQRVKLQRQADALHNDGKDVDAKAVEKQIEALLPQIRELQTRVASRTEEFKRQLAAAFPGQIAPEGSEVLDAAWKDAALTVTIATLSTPDTAQLAGLAKSLGRRDELASVTAVAATGSKPGFTLTATYRQKPQSLTNYDLTDPLVSGLKTRFAAVAGTSAEVANAQTKAAFELFNAAATQAAKERITIARSFPASEHFSGQVAGQMQLRALIAVLLSLLAILAYVAARFEFRFGIGAVVSLLHDVALTVGLVALFGVRIDLTVIAAILTIIGYSINDTIVTFDRIRENLRKHQWGLIETIDISIAQTLARTVLTTATVWLTVFLLWLYAGESLYAFSTTLLIGITLGTYSSIFVAAPLLLELSKKGKVALVAPAPVDIDALGGEAKPAEKV
jgi:SecD/SecF fusion protein